MGACCELRLLAVADGLQGKSLSLICASLTWLRDHKRRRFEEGLDWGDEGDLPLMSYFDFWIMAEFAYSW